jgi:hypothetical protein
MNKRYCWKLCFFSLAWINVVLGKEGALQTPMVYQFPQTSSSHDMETLKNFKAITVLLHIPDVSPEVAQKIEQEAIQGLSKWGTVVVKPLSLQTLTEELGKKTGFLNNPFLTYILQQEDTEAPLFQASLRFEAPVTIEKNKEYCHPILWLSDSYVLVDPSRNCGWMISQTLLPLLENFSAAFAKANPNTAKPTLYLMKVD